MAGHNKWSKVKHIKAREDAKKETLFSEFAPESSIAARDGDLDPRLRIAIDNAKNQSMPKDNIERAIKKGSGELGAEDALPGEDASSAPEAARFFEQLDDYDDTMTGHTNFEVAEAVLAGLAA